MTRLPGLTRVTLCRGCCCGTVEARPTTDHAAQVTRLQRLAEEGLLRCRVSDCLGPCEEANVLVVSPTPAARRRGARPVWLGGVDDAELDLVLTWIDAGGPGEADLPAPLQPRRLPPRRDRVRTDVGSAP